MAKDENKEEEKQEELKSVEIQKDATPVEDIEVISEEVVEDAAPPLSADIPAEAPADQLPLDKAVTPEESTSDLADEIVSEDKNPKYEVTDAKIEKYLRSGKKFDIVTQRRKGGNFVGGRGEIYIPLSLIKK